MSTQAQLSEKTAPREFASYDAFFAYYLQQHSDPRNRALHAVGLLCGFAVLVSAFAFRHPWWALAGFPVSYAFSWFGHLVIEGNRPATWGHPWWSFVSDFRMTWWMVTGKMR